MKYPVPPPGASEPAKSSPTLAELFEGRRDTSVAIKLAFQTMAIRDRAVLLADLSSEPLPIRRERDRLIAEAAARFFLETWPTRSAKALAAALARHAASADWYRDRYLAELPPDTSARRHALHDILRANSGVPLGWQIYDILVASGPPFQKKTSD